MVSQRVALRVAVLENTAFPTHGSLRQICKEMAGYIGYPCKSNTDLSKLRPHRYWALAIFQHRLASLFPRNCKGEALLSFSNTSPILYLANKIIL